MLELLQRYSLSDILIFIILLALAVRSSISFFDWAYNQVQKLFNKGYSKADEKKQLERRLNHGSELMNELRKEQKNTDEILECLSNKIDMLVESDRDSIKAYITEKHHHFCYQVGWIDDFSLECLERCFKHYRDEGGNSFIGGFMDELRNLPKGSAVQDLPNLMDHDHDHNYDNC